MRPTDPQFRFRFGRSSLTRLRVRTLWPQLPLAVFLASIGTLNLLDALSLPIAAFQRFHALNGLAESLSMLGSTAQVILGALLIVAGLGLMWRSVSAWVVSVLLLTVILAIGIARAQWGVGLALQVVALLGLVAAKRRFTRRTVFASVVFSVITIVAILTYGVVGSYLLGAGFRPAITNLSTAFYYTIVTLSTVGYGDIVPVSSAARWFSISLLIVGLSVFATAIISVIGPKISLELARLFNPKDAKMDLHNHVILVGNGAIARNTIAELQRRGVPFVQILPVSAVEDPPPHAVVRGEATNEAVLIEAGIHSARLVIAAHDDDGENAFICLGAKELNANLRVLAVASSARAIRRLKLARADLVFSPVAVGSRLLADLVEGTPIAPEFQDLLEASPNKA